MKQIIKNKKCLFRFCTSIRKVIIIIVLMTVVGSNITMAETGRFRAMFGNDPSTEMTIGFDAYATNTNPVLYYSTSPANVSNSNNFKSPDTFNSNSEMENRFVRLTGLQPGQTYYFVVKDNTSTSEVYSFETISNNNSTPLSIIAGGDSRNNYHILKKANSIVAKLQPHAVVFNGDFTDDRTPQEWKDWLDDWQLSFNSSNRITPIISSLGNHDRATQLVDLFDCPANMYYTKSLGGNLIDIHTLNSTMTFSGASAQTTWLEDKLTNSSSIWKFVQYHHPIRPHYSGKIEGAIQYAYWANIFYQYGVDAVLEGDAHLVKTTWPLIPCSGGFGCDEGFKRDDINGTVYLGEGSYAAPLRPADDDKAWTRDMGSFHQFKWLFVNKDSMSIRTVKYDSSAVNLINELPLNDRFPDTIPQGLDTLIWNPSNGDVVTLYKPTSNIPVCNLTVPGDNAMYFNLDNIILSANASGTSTISEVQFYVNGAFAGADSTAPYAIDWQPTSNGEYTISAIAQDVNGLTSSIDFSVISIANKTNIDSNSCIDIASDEYYEKSNGTITKTAKVKISGAGSKIQGLRFRSVNIPPGAIIDSAYITFQVKGSSTVSTATFWAEKAANSLPFKGEKYHLANRIKTDNALTWNMNQPWYNCEEHKSIDLSPVIQELVNLPNWTIESPVTFLISGSGNREAVSSSATNCSIIPGNNSVATIPPKLTVVFSIPDCATNITINANAGSSLPLNTLYESRDTIKTEVTTSPNADVIIGINESVDLKSDHIKLNEGFKVEIGGCLNAVIEPCD